MLLWFLTPKKKNQIEKGSEPRMCALKKLMKGAALKALLTASTAESQ